VEYRKLKLLKPSQSLILICLSLSLFACNNAAPPSPLLSAEPAVDASLTRAPRTLRLFYSALPDVSQSSLRLVGPNGEEFALRGLHTMAADDLMIEIMDPVVPGTYTVFWSTTVEGDPTHYEGSYQFTYSE
jgi:methionine-rich copper-binding protein CopC